MIMEICKAPIPRLKTLKQTQHIEEVSKRAEENEVLNEPSG